jgi:CubicO group peptidase (beta-lactamase class C family)
MPEVQVDPSDVGFAADRLARISSHFETYVDDGRLPGWQIVVNRGGRTVYSDTYGHRDVENGLAVENDTIFRMYSMTKPVTSVAAMMLYERGLLELNDPVSKYVPCFGDQRVYLRGPASNPATTAQAEPMTIAHLLTHTSGLTYGFTYAHGIDHLYRQARFEWGAPKGATLQECCEAWAKIPLLFQPGSEWNYSVSTDVLGRVIEVVSGQTLDVFFQENILGPLGMKDTAFWCDDARADRFAALYVPAPGTRKAFRMDALGQRGSGQPSFLSGGGGLVSTADDYLRFAEMLRGGGALGEARLLGSRTVKFMTTNHLPGNGDLTQVGRPLFSESSYDGVGFGLGFSVVMDPAKSHFLSSPGEYGWGGAASTFFMVDPLEDITAVFLTQLLPSSTWPVRNELRRLILSALID